MPLFGHSLRSISSFRLPSNNQTIKQSNFMHLTKLAFHNNQRSHRSLVPGPTLAQNGAQTWDHMCKKKSRPVYNVLECCAPSTSKALSNFNGFFYSSTRPQFILEPGHLQICIVFISKHQGTLWQKNCPNDLLEDFHLLSPG